MLLARRIPADGVQLLSSCTEYVADKECKLQWRSVGDPHVEKSFVWRRLTPELSRAALRPWASENYQSLHEAAKRARLERIVSHGSTDQWLSATRYSDLPFAPKLGIG